MAAKTVYFPLKHGGYFHSVLSTFPRGYHILSINIPVLSHHCPIIIPKPFQLFVYVSLAEGKSQKRKHITIFPWFSYGKLTLEGLPPRLVIVQDAIMPLEQHRDRLQNPRYGDLATKGSQKAMVNLGFDHDLQLILLENDGFYDTIIYSSTGK